MSAEDGELKATGAGVSPCMDEARGPPSVPVSPR